MKSGNFYTTCCLVVTLLVLNLFTALAQTNLQAPAIIEENFDDCVLPAGWTSNLLGYQGASWGVGIPDNDNSGGASIDGTCMVFFDDDATGGGTATWTAQVTSPAFDGTGPAGGILLLEADVHFRNYNGSDAFTIYVSQNGTTNWVPVAVYQDQNYNGDNFNSYVHANIDISAFAGPNMRVRFEYYDGNDWNWWAAFDNFKVSRALFVEDFDDCALPPGWLSFIDSGDFGWNIGNDDDAWPYNMDGSCMVYFNDDALGQAATPSSAVLVSPAFDATVNATIALDIDVHFRAYQGQYLAIGVLLNGDFMPVKVFVGEDFEGTNYGEYGHVTLDLSPYRSHDMRLVFGFGDGGTWGWWASFDNIKVSGWGELNDVCTRAEPVAVNGPCVEATNVNAIFEGPAAACVDSTKSGIWFSFVAPASGIVTINSASNFNEVITLFSGNCNSLNAIACTNRDEFGFTGENLRVTGLSNGQTYYVRVSGRVGSFGSTEGTTCLSITGGGTPPAPPANDNCSGAVQLTLNGSCISGNNRNATLETNEPVPSLNNRSRASIWYRFTAPASGRVVLNSGADFADVITVYSGNCGALTEVGGSDYGHTIELNGLTAGQTYRVQITGYFATVEGNVCMAITNPPPPPANDVCTQAIDLIVGDACTLATNQSATFTGPTVDLQVPFTGYAAATTGSTNYYYRPDQGATCTVSTVYVRYDVFNFTPTISGSYTIINTYPEMDGYLHVYAGSFDPNNPCATYVNGNDDYNGIEQSLVAVNLTAGTTYYVVTSAYGANQAGAYSTQIMAPAPVVNHNATTVGSPDYYLRPNQGTTCTVSAINVQYDVFTFSVTNTATYTITNTYSGFDGYMHLYSGSFNPTDPCATYVNGNDDYNGTTQSRIVLNLTAGLTYYLVTSAYAANQSGAYSTDVTTLQPAAGITQTLYDVNINGQPTSCDINPSAAIWFSFTAPASGKIYATTDADFVHVLSVFSGVCGNLTEVQCEFNPSRCGEPVLISNLTPGQQYYLQIASANNPFGYTYGEVCIQLKDAQYDPVKAKIKVFLQGPYLGNGSMSTTLKQYNLIPDTQPFNQSPWNYNGNECLDEIPNNMVDWVLVELRNAANNNQIVEQKAALLLNNGSVADKGKDGVRFYNIPPNSSYYVVIRHRNHLAVMSSVPVPLPNINPYNFAADGSYVLGNQQTVAMPDGNWAMRAGDFNADGVFTVADFNFYTGQASMLNQYVDSDCNLDRTVTVADFNLYTPNASTIGIQQIRY
ncbi:hypothetical protein C7N43_11035 [Sphingobacteriales bacterium UPWRP_1]|nr:hypothetical protein B6N25_12765 [Sphingobacteriales bacterium TSM_CSS]PSJ76962.1 hypothetical protein C7N43_11035 [Sphingobacteriales bacterium UPWRP_1]